MSAKQKDVGSSPAHDQKYCVHVFFGLVRLFFHKFFKCLQRVPLPFFPFCQRMVVQKRPKAPLYILRHYATYRRPKRNFEKSFEKKSKTDFFKFLPHAGTVEENT